MSNINNWDWETHEKKIDLNIWKNQYNWVEESYVSSDGEKIASIVNIDDGEFNVCVNGKLWGESSEKIWHLRFSPDNRLTALVADEEEWTLSVNGFPWENRFDYAWNPVISDKGDSFAIAAKDDTGYKMVLNDIPWNGSFPNISNFTMDFDGKNTAAAVQIKEAKEGEIFKFQEGCFTAALNGEPWESTFLNVWNMVIGRNGDKLAAEVRLNLYEYTIAVNGKTWNEHYQCVWAPAINPFTGAVVAPVQCNGKWSMAEDGNIIWDRFFVQALHQIFSPDGSRLAAIVAPEFGKWTLAVEGKPWKLMIDDFITDPVFSLDGTRLAALVKNNENWSIAVDGIKWDNDFDMIWKPVFSPDNSLLAAKVEKNGKYSIAVNDKVWKRKFDMIWEPFFSPNGDKLLIRCIENGIYYRRVVAVTDILEK